MIALMLYKNGILVVVMENPILDSLSGIYFTIYDQIQICIFISQLLGHINNKKHMQSQKIQPDPLQSEQQLILTDEDRLKIIDNVLKQLNLFKNSHLPLEISLSAQPMKTSKNLSFQSHTQNRNNQEIYLQYNIPGSKYKHRSRLSNLLEKLSQMQKNEEMENQQILSKERQRNKDMENQRQNQDKNKEESAESCIEEAEDPISSFKAEDNYRYYKDNILCFKCGKPGHYKSVCPSANSCMYCFSQQHQPEACPQKKVCFRCYGFGHIIANCSSKQPSSKCHWCEKYHGQGCYFLINRNRDATRKKQFYDMLYTDKDIKCAKCFSYGHIDCLQQN